MGIGSNDAADEAKTGIVHGHAYTLIGVYEIGNI